MDSVHIYALALTQLLARLSGVALEFGWRGAGLGNTVLPRKSNTVAHRIGFRAHRNTVVWPKHLFFVARLQFSNSLDDIPQRKNVPRFTNIRKFSKEVAFLHDLGR